ncbi:MAG: cysteine-rich small domain-containing protein [Anaeromicrobium sp.]|uniref:cysteine-rich small domain-containing protein n=1 Tax=Anaeromicrobium sp. TaxID=1929132 RepID=UPI0025F5D8A5|nr:cysteine-rich small domain-containing protein [Anaeromicrobium sp.]MCT4595077.1 cysteine-rich small domain-containing protein [Anaeromicrobium sp.]
MSENYKFNQNRKCEYFPCHKVSDPEKFNCLFCYCPLYMLKENCGGNFKYNNGIKDCSACLVPHGPNGYDHVMSKMGEVIRIGSERE